MCRQHYERMARQASWLRIALTGARWRGAPRFACVGGREIDKLSARMRCFRRVAFADPASRLSTNSIGSASASALRSLQRRGRRSPGGDGDADPAFARALAYFGDMDVSALREQPPRQPIDTRILPIDESARW